MTLNNETLMTAIAAVAMLIGLGQLIMMLPKTRRRNTTEKTSWSIWRAVESGTMWWLFLVAMEGISRYALRIADPTKWDIYYFGMSVLMIAVWYCLVVAKSVLRRNATRHQELQERVRELETRLSRASDLHSLR